MISQKEIRKYLDEYEVQINLKWKGLSEPMRQIVLEARHEWIMDLQELQIRKFDREA